MMRAGPDGYPEATDRNDLVRLGLATLFEDQKFSGDLMAKLFRLGMSEQEMDAIFKQAENEIIGFVETLSPGTEQGPRDAVGGFVLRLKRQILRNPTQFAKL